MSTDEQFVAHLKALESTPPDSTVDPHRVLVAGRRRRAARGTGIAVLSLAVVTVLYTSVAALPDRSGPVPPATVLTPTPAPSATLTAPRAIVDPLTGDVTLPLTPYRAGPDDVALMMTAHDLAISRCMAEAGFSDAYRFTGPTPADAAYQWYGVTTRAQVERDGYTFPKPATDSGSDVDLEIPGARDALAACLPRVLAMGFVYEPGDDNGLDQPTDVPTPAKDTAEGQALVADLSACLRDHGAPGIGPASPDALIPEGVLGLPHEEQVRIGLIDLECRESIDFLQRFADVDAQQQQVYLDDNRDYFEAYKAMHDASMAASTAYLAAAGIVMDGS